VIKNEGLKMEKPLFCKGFLMIYDAG